MEAELYYLSSMIKPKSGQPLARVSYVHATVVSGTTVVPWDTTTQVANGATASASGIVVPTSGYYQVSGAITFGATGTAPYVGPAANKYGQAVVTLGGTIKAKGSTVQTTSTVNGYTSIVSDIIYLNANSTPITLSAIASNGLYIYGIQDSLAVTGTFLTYMSVVLVSAQ
jgi:hypothetical protein